VFVEGVALMAVRLGWVGLAVGGVGCAVDPWQPAHSLLLPVNSILLKSSGLPGAWPLCLQDMSTSESTSV